MLQNLAVYFWPPLVGGAPLDTSVAAYEPALQTTSGLSVMAGMLFSLLLCLLLCWVVWQLCRADVAAQFRG